MGIVRTKQGQLCRIPTSYVPKDDRDFEIEIIGKLLQYEPPYEVGKLLDYHLNYFVDSGGNEEEYLKHIKYVVFEEIKNNDCPNVRKELIADWLNKHLNSQSLDSTKVINITGNHNTVVSDNTKSHVNIHTENKVSIAELQQCITDLINQKDFIKPHLATEVYEALQEDLEYVGKALSKPKADVSKIQSILQSILAVLNAIPNANDAIMKTMETIKMLWGLF
jgi:hypothetical protein